MIRSCNHFSIGIFIILLLGISCRSNTNESGGSGSDIVIWETTEAIDRDLPKIREDGVLRAVLENNSTSYFLYKAKAMGYEYEMLNKLADHLGLRLEIVVETDISKAFEMLHLGEVDIIAFKLTVTKNRRQWFQFTDPLYQVQQVLVQRKPDNWRDMRLHEIERSLIRNPADLIGKEIHVRKNSSYVPRLQNLSDEIGGEIMVIESYADLDTESIIKKVVDGEIDFTVADDDIAQVNATYFPILDVDMALSLPQQIAWALRKNADSLGIAINEWIEEEKRGSDFYVIYNRYFRSPKGSLARARSEFSSISGQRISIYDEQIKAAAAQINWDWRLLAALIFQESRFNAQAESWAGAQGLMQMMPATASEYGAENPFDVVQSLNAGTKYIDWLDRIWTERIPDKQERIKFVLASYNVGLGHVEDAVRLAEKFGANSNIWDSNVETYLEKKSEPQYFNDEVVRFGYCRGHEPVNYVKNIMYRFNQYMLFINEQVEELEES